VWGLVEPRIAQGRGRAGLGAGDEAADGARGDGADGDEDEGEGPAEVGDPVHQTWAARVSGGGGGGVLRGGVQADEWAWMEDGEISEGGMRGLEGCGRRTSRFATNDRAADTEEGGGAESGKSQRLQIDRDSLEAEQFVQFKLCTSTDSICQRAHAIRIA
jgi:hypothetical protein